MGGVLTLRATADRPRTIRLCTAQDTQKDMFMYILGSVYVSYAHASLRSLNELASTMLRTWNLLMALSLGTRPPHPSHTLSAPTRPLLHLLRPWFLLLTVMFYSVLLCVCLVMVLVMLIRVWICGFVKETKEHRRRLSSRAAATILLSPSNTFSSDMNSKSSLDISTKFRNFRRERERERETYLYDLKWIFDLKTHWLFLNTNDCFDCILCVALFYLVVVITHTRFAKW